MKNPSLNNLVASSGLIKETLIKVVGGRCSPADNAFASQYLNALVIKFILDLVDSDVPLMAL